MKLNLKKLEGVAVYKEKDTEPCGKVTGVCFSENDGRIKALLVESLSLIPVSKTIFVNEIHKATDKKIVLKAGVAFENKKSCRQNMVSEKEILGVRISEKKFKKIKDIKFDFETGEIIDIVVKSNMFNKKEKLSVNKIKIKDNTIYIE